MAINFPDSPSNGDTQTINGSVYTYNSTTGKWDIDGDNTTNVTVSDTAPSGAVAGDQWFNSTDGSLYVYYNDGSSSQWVGISGPAGSSGEAGAAGGVTSYANKAAIDAVSSPSEGDLAFDEDKNVLYIRAGSAWKRVSVGVDESPVVTTEPATTHALNGDGSTSTVTMVAYDPEGFGITYGIAYPNASNALPNQLANATAINQNTGVFTFDPSTSSSHAGNVNVRLSASDGISTTTRIVALSLVFPVNHGARGIHFFGSGSNGNVINYFNIASAANAADFGDQNTTTGGGRACSNGTRALRTGGGWINGIDYITTATLGNATSFGILSDTLGVHAAVSNGIYGIVAGGRLGSVNGVNNMEYVTIANEGNSSDFGDLTEAKTRCGGAANTTYGLIAGGLSTTVINRITMATTSNATSFGNLSGSSTSYVDGSADATRAIWKMGAATNELQYSTISTSGTASDFGDLTTSRQQSSICSDYTYAVISGGDDSGFVPQNIMDRVTIQTTGNATDFGDLTGTTVNGCSTSGAAA